MPRKLETHSPKGVAAYVRVTLERGLNHEPFSLRHDSIERIDMTPEDNLLVVFYNGQRFTLAITESEEPND